MLNIRCSVMVIYHLNVVHNAEGLKLKKGERNGKSNYIE